VKEFTILKRLTKINFIVSILISIGIFVFVGVLISNNQKKKIGEIYQDDDFMEMQSAKIFIAPFPTDRNKFQIIIPSNDGTINVNVFAVKEDLISLKKDIESKIKE
jgi:hypothetical protein